VANILWSAVSYCGGPGKPQRGVGGPGVVRSQSNDATAEIAGVGQAWASPDCGPFFQRGARQTIPRLRATTLARPCPPSFPAPRSENP